MIILPRMTQLPYPISHSTLTSPFAVLFLAGPYHHKTIAIALISTLTTQSTNLN